MDEKKFIPIINPEFITVLSEAINEAMKNYRLALERVCESVSTGIEQQKLIRKYHFDHMAESNEAPGL